MMLVKEKFNEVRKQGYIKTLRNGSTGVGYTFEAMMGIKENNLVEPDLDGVEIKTHRQGSKSLITLFTSDRKSWQKNSTQKKIIEKYGFYNKGRINLYSTITTIKPNSQGLYLQVGDDGVSIQHVTNIGKIATWQYVTLLEKFTTKLSALLFVTANTKRIDGIEYFHYVKGQILKGLIGKNTLKALFENGDIVIDLRLHIKTNKNVKNHGTGFRIKTEKLSKIFTQIENL